MQNNRHGFSLGIVVAIVAALILVGGGVVIAIMISRSNSTSNSQTTSPAQDSTPTEKTVAKTGVCHTGETKHLGSGNFEIGVDMASGEYVVKNDAKKDAPYVSLYVYPSKEGAQTDEFNRTELAIFDANETRTAKLDTGNYLKVVYGGLLTCQ